MTDQTSRKTIFLRSLLLLAVLLGTGGTVGRVLIALRVEPPRRSAGTLPPLVEVTLLREETVVEWFTGYGTASAIRKANVAAEVAATVVERVENIRAGSAVDAGQILVRLDDREYRFALDRARALADAQHAELEELDASALGLEPLIHTAGQELRVARDERARLADLFERDLAAKKEYDFASLAYQQARRVRQGYEREAATFAPRRKKLEAAQRGFEAEAALAALNIERCTLRAPFAGRIQTLNVDAGDRVAPGTVLLTLLDLSIVEIPLRLPASLYDLVQVGASCRVESESRPDHVWQATVTRTSAAADERTRTFAVYVEVDNRRQALPLLAGTFVTARVRGPVHHHAIVLPRSACRNGRVFVAEAPNDHPDNPERRKATPSGSTVLAAARLRTVVTRRFVEDRALVEEGLRIGERVILTHLDQLVDGTPVRVHVRPSTESTVGRVIDPTKRQVGSMTRPTPPPNRVGASP